MDKSSSDNLCECFVASRLWLNDGLALCFLLQLPIALFRSIRLYFSYQFSWCLSFPTISKFAIFPFVSNFCPLSLFPWQPCPTSTPARTDLSRTTRDQWEIPRESLAMVKKLGAGQFGEVRTKNDPLQEQNIPLFLSLSLSLFLSLSLSLSLFLSLSLSPSVSLSLSLSLSLFLSSHFLSLCFLLFEFSISLSLFLSLFLFLSLPFSPPNSLPLPSPLPLPS